MSPNLGYPRPGERIGPYVVTRRLGGGGMGVVFEATDETLGRQVAVKVISPHLADDPAFRDRFVREARAMARLDSAHVVHVYSHGEQDGRLYLVTQLVPDGDLGALLEAHGAPPPAMALDLIAQVAAGLADAHAFGIVHRDIKPANVLLRRRPEGNVAYLGDFGIARQADVEPSRITTGTVGTPTYMAPELHTGGSAGVASDIYSLGCLLWAALTGHAPYAGTSDFEVITAHLGRPVPQLAGSSPLVVATNAILRRAMAKEPGQRYPSAAAMREDLLAAARLESAGAVVPARPAGSRPRSPLRWVLAAAAVVAVVAALVAGVVVGQPSSDSAATARPRLATTPPSPSGSPSDRSSEVSSRDEATARANFSRALQAQGLFSADQADCVARSVVDEVGLPTLIDDGFFGADLSFKDPDLATLPEVKSALTTATFSCLQTG